VREGKGEAHPKRGGRNATDGQCGTWEGGALRGRYVEGLDEQRLLCLFVVHSLPLSPATNLLTNELFRVSFFFRNPNTERPRNQVQNLLCGREDSGCSE